MSVAPKGPAEGAKQASPGVCEPAAVGIDFFKRFGSKYLLLMDHFSGLPMFAHMGVSTDTEPVVRQLKRWFATFDVARSIRYDNGPPFFSMAFKALCDEYCIDLQITSPYKTKEEGLCKEEALAAFKNTRNEDGLSPNQLLFLRNWRDPSLQSLLAVPVVEMVRARDRVRAGGMVTKDEDKRGWKQLNRGDQVRGRNPKTKEWSMKGEVEEGGPRRQSSFRDDGRQEH